MGETLRQSNVSPVWTHPFQVHISQYSPTTMNDQDHDAVLRDALAFIDTFEEDDNGMDLLSALDAPPQPCALVSNLDFVPSTKPIRTGRSTNPRQRKRSPWYLKQRTELQSLRDLAIQLEYRLEKLHQRPENRPLACVPAVDNNGALVVGIWQEVVRRQFKQRQRAEKENLQLKKLLKEQTRIVKAIERVFTTKRTNDAQALVQTDTEDLHRPGVFLAFLQASNLFMDLFTSIDMQYLRTDRIVAKVQKTNPSTNYYDVRVVPDPTMGLIVETIEHRILPFPYEITVKAAWDSVLQAGFENPHHIEKTDNEQQVHVQIGELMQVFSTSRKYIESGRTVLVSAGISDPRIIPEMSVDGVHMRHEGWTIIEPVPSTEASSALGMTRVTTYVIGIPVAKDASDIPRKATALVEFFANALRYNRDPSREMLENRLFEYSVGRIEMIES